MTFVDQPVCDMRVDPAGLLSDHALVTCRVPVTVDRATVVERLVRGWRQVDRDKLRQALMISPLCQAVSDDADVDELFETYAGQFGSCRLQLQSLSISWTTVTEPALAASTAADQFQTCQTLLSGDLFSTARLPC